MANIIWFIFWFLIFWFVSFFVAVIAAVLFIITNVLEVVFADLSGFNAMLLKCILLPRYCAEGMRDLKKPF